MSLEARFYLNCAAARRGCHYDVCTAIRDAGAENVRVETLVLGPKLYILKLEDRMVELYQTTDPLYGYNMVRGGGSTGPLVTAEFRLKERLAHLGKKHSPERVEAIRQGLHRRHEHARTLRACREFRRECRAMIRDAHASSRHASRQLASRRLKDIEDRAQHARLLREREQAARCKDQLRRRIVTWCVSKHLEGDLTDVIRAAVKNGARRVELIELLNHRRFKTVTGERWDDPAIRVALKALGIKHVHFAPQYRGPLLTVQNQKISRVSNPSQPMIRKKFPVGFSGTYHLR